MIIGYNINVEINQIGDSFLLGFLDGVLAKLDFSFSLPCPIFSNLLPFEMIADSWMIFDSDNGAPTFAVFSFRWMPS